MGNTTATIRELRTDFRSIKRKVEEHGEIVITDRGTPAYVLKPVVPPAPRPVSPPDYYARLVKRQAQPMTAEATQRFWEEERRDF